MKSNQESVLKNVSSLKELKLKEDNQVRMIDEMK